MKTKAIKGRLLCSAPTQTSIITAVNAFYYSTSKDINFETGEVINGNGAVLEGVRVILKGKRYRFESIPTGGTQ